MQTMEFQDFFFKTLSSTQDWAKEHLDEFDLRKIICITADEQTKGRGRFQRQWVSPPNKNLYVTFVFRLPAAALHLTSLAQILSLSLAKLLIARHLSPEIKWPNDVRLSHKKLAGILCETSYQKEHVDLFLGIGINVNMGKDDLERIDQPATSLFVETGREWDRKDLLLALKKEFLQDLTLFKEKGFTPFHSALENLLAFKHKEVEIFDGKRTWKGILHSLTFDGQLNLYLADGSMRTIASGDLL